MLISLALLTKILPGVYFAGRMVFMLTYVLAGIALSMDAFAVSVSSGICIADMKFRHALRTAFMFGLFQFIMPLLGYAAGSTFADLIQTWDHWLAFGLLAFVGGKMLIDALAVGISYSLIQAPIWLASSIIGLITFVLCLLGCEFGKRLGAKFELGAEILGGVVLLGIAVKILLEHLLAK